MTDRPQRITLFHMAGQLNSDSSGYSGSVPTKSFRGVFKRRQGEQQPTGESRTLQVIPNFEETEKTFLSTGFRSVVGI